MSMLLKVISLNKMLYEGQVKELVVATPSGEIAILRDHIPLISTVVESNLRIIDEADKEHKVPIKSGIVEVHPENAILVLAET